MENVATDRYQSEASAVDIQHIPIIDIEPLVNGSDSQKVVDQIGEVCEKIGFLYIKNHGISATLISKINQYSQEFFSMPLEEKNKLNIVNRSPTLRGYIPRYGENVDPNHTKDFKECFDFACSDKEVTPFFGPNLMPESIPGFQETMEQYHQEMLLLAHKLTGAIALSLGLPKDYFYKLQKKPISVLRLLHYPPQSGNITRDEIGIGEHTDYGFLTILAQDSVGGLQVTNLAGDWISAPPIDGTFIVNIGDLVQTYTNDKYTSTYHRVINTSGKERYSFPFFIDMDFNAIVEPLPTCLSDENPAKYQAYTCGEHKYSRYVDSYKHLQNLNAG